MGKTHNENAKEKRAMVRTSRNLTVGEYCKQYRTLHNTPLVDIAGEINIQTLYSFESGKSTNYKHLKHYLRLAYSKGENISFSIGLIESLVNED